MSKKIDRQRRHWNALRRRKIADNDYAIWIALRREYWIEVVRRRAALLTPSLPEENYAIEAEKMLACDIVPPHLVSYHKEIQHADVAGPLSKRSGRL